jgi:hypothetical protein
MTTQAIARLHDIHTATNDILKGYREMAARAQPEIQLEIRQLIKLHERHAAEQSAELLRLREAGTDDASLQGTVNKVVVILRDWLSDLDRDALPAVRDGEVSLRDEYDKALGDGDVARHPTIALMLRAQRDAISQEIARMPKD